MLAATALAVVVLRDLVAMTMMLGVYSLLSATLFVALDAVDVAFTEASVGAGISTVLMLSTLALTTRSEGPREHTRALPLVVVLVTGGALVYGTLDMPRWGDPDAPIHGHVAPRYLQSSPAETGVPNVVTSVLASYRGYDTLGEVTVIFTAGVGVLVLIGMTPRVSTPREGNEGEEEGTVPRHPVIEVVASLFIPLILLFALYVQFHGDFGPGGGFQAGVILGAGFILYSLVFGLRATWNVVPRRALLAFMPAGVLLYCGVGITGVLLAGNFLEYRVLALDPVHGQHLGITLVEIGVGVTVASVMIVIFLAFSGRARRQAD